MSCEEYRKEIAKALECIKNEKIIRRIYIGVLVARSNYCDIATEGEQHE